MERLRFKVDRQPDATLRKLKERLGVTLRDCDMIRALGRLNLTLKKSIKAVEQKRKAVGVQRSLWIVSRCGVDPARFVINDEPVTSKLNATS